MDPKSDIDLLRLEMATLWTPDAYGRQTPEPLVAVAIANDGRAVRFGAEVPDEARTRAVIEASDPQEILSLYQSRLSSAGKVQGGPSFVFTGLIEVRSSDLVILTSEENASPTLAAARPEAWWEPQEWDDLLAGRLGPWAVGMVGSRVVTLCHTPVGSAVAAEAGVWTHPQARGRGYAVAVTAAWAKVAQARFEILFYSTQADNAASQAVACKLGLRPIGWIWQLREESAAVS